METTLSNVLEENRELQDRLKGLYEVERMRVDSLLAKQTDIIDSRLGLSQATPGRQAETPRSVPRRMNFGQVRAEFEKKKREEHWTKVIEEVEKKDGKGNSSKSND